MNKSMLGKLFKALYLPFLCLSLTASGYFLLSEGTVSAAGTINGTVYIDYNMNGVRNTTATSPNRAFDKGIAGVTVTAYDSAGVQRGTDVTDSGGSYSISATGTGPYRIEFSTLPSGYFPSQVGSNNATTVRFVPDGNSNGVDFGIVSTADYCQNSPNIATTCFRGTVSGSSNGLVIASLPYASGTTSTTSSSNVTNPTTHALSVAQNVVGSVHGLAYHRNSQMLFASAFTKRHAGFRNNNKNTASNDPTGEIFITPSTGTTASLFLNLNTLFGSNIAGANPHDVTNYQSDNTAFDAIGKTALGDIELSPDGTVLYAVNLFDRNLYAIPLGTGTPTAPSASGDVTVYDLAALMNPGTGATGCPLDPATPAGTMNLNLRPGGLKTSGDKVYVSLTCTAQSTGSASQLRGFIYDLDPAGAGSATQVANFSLNHTRGCASFNGSVCGPANWQAWTASQAALLTYAPWGQQYLPQPWLLDIELDQDGFMIVAIADRAGHQLGNDNAGANTGLIEGVAAGDTVRLSPSGGTWTLENNGSDGVNTTAGAGSGEGPGNGEFYYQDGFSITSGAHSEITVGGLLNVSGYREVVIAVMDPAPTTSLPSGQNTWRAGGLIWLSNITGARTRSYQIFNIDDPNTFGKAAGMGDVEVFCNTPPLQIGNLVWNDIDSDGVQDPGEAGIQSVTVQLWADTNSDGMVDTQVGTATTDSGGNYVFGGITNQNMTGGNTLQPNTVYEVRLPASNFAGGQPLNAFAPTNANNDPTTDGDTRDSDGIVFTGSEVIGGLTTGSNGENNHTYDFGFKSAATGYSVGNRIWYDTDNDGIIDPAEVGINGVSVSLFVDGNSDGVPDSPGSPVGTTSTDADGYYRFDGLSAGTYVVRVNPGNFAPAAVLANYRNTTGNNTGDVESSGAVSNAENGVEPAAAASVLSAGLLSNTITLGGAPEPLAEADVPAAGSFAGQGSLDSLADMTVDFGFYALSISGTVWHDTGAGVPADLDDGELDAAEARLSGFTVRLYDSGGTEIPVGPDGILGTADDTIGGVTTDASGDYSFQGLPGGTFRVVLDPGTAFSSTPTETDPNTNGDNNDNGFPDNTGSYTGQFISGLLTLTAGNAGAMNNNTVNNANATTSDPTVDFGLLLAPTSVKISDVNAVFDGSGTEITWTTGDESINVGFNVYRREQGFLVRLTSALVPGTALRNASALAASGNSYSVIDKGSGPGAVYFIEDIDLKGDRTMHGPFTSKGSFSPPMRGPIAKLLDKLPGSRAAEATQLDLAGRSDESPEQDGSSLSADYIGGGVKIRVGSDGWVDIPFARLAAVGFDTGSDPSLWRLATGGREVRPLIDTANGGRLGFYGKAADTLESGERVYYLNADSGNGDRLPRTANGEPGEKRAEFYGARAVRKARQLYVAGILNGDAPNWFGEVITPQQETTVPVDLKDVHTAGGNQARLTVRLQGYTEGDHVVEIGFNGTSLGSVQLSSQENAEFSFDISPAELLEGANTLTLRSAGEGYDVSLVDEVSVDYNRRYKAVSDRLLFSVPAGRNAFVDGFGGGGIRVFELGADGEAAGEVLVESANDGNSYGFTISASARSRQFYAASFSSTEGTPVGIERDNPSDLRNPSNSAELIILTPRTLLAPAEELAMHRANGGLKTITVTADDVYDEFGDGSPSAEAIRSFLEFASNGWSGRLRYVILFGDSTYDPRNFLGRPDKAYLPMKPVDTEFMETASDGWFTDLNGDGIEDIAIGRIPAGTPEEAAVIVSKLKTYDSQSLSFERRALLVSDTAFGNFNESLRSLIPQSVKVDHIERGAESDAQTGSRLLRELNSGPDIVAINGHGSQTFWASNELLNNTRAASLNNHRHSFVMMLTCLTGYSHYPQADSLAESLLKSQGGAIAVWSSSGMTYTDRQMPIGVELFRAIYASDVSGMRLGDIVREAKKSSPDPDVRRTWQLIGDPTIIIR